MKYNVQIKIQPEDHSKRQRINNFLSLCLEACANEIAIEQMAGDILCGSHARTLNIFNLGKYGEYTNIANPYPASIDKKYEINIFINGLINDY